MQREDDPKEDRSSDSVFVNTTNVVQSVIGLNNGLPFARSEDYPSFVKAGRIFLYFIYLINLFIYSSVTLSIYKN